MSEAPTPEIMVQVSDQCKVVAHLARAISDVHEDYATLFSAGDKGPKQIADMVGARTASFMETLGEMLNGMDACDDADNWTAPIFHEAQRLWPVSTESDSQALASAVVYQIEESEGIIRLSVGGIEVCAHQDGTPQAIALLKFDAEQRGLPQ